MRAFFTTIGIFILLATTAVAQSQSQSSGFDPSKLVYSGTFNFAFTNNFSSVTISPQVGYAFNKFFTAGAGINYNYRGNANTSLNFLGLNVYGRAMPIQYVALQVQPEGHYMWGKNLGAAKSKLIPCMLVGAGVVIPSGNVGAINAMIYYDVIQYKYNGINYSPYGDKVIYSVGFIFSF